MNQLKEDVKVEINESKIRKNHVSEAKLVDVSLNDMEVER